MTVSAAADLAVYLQALDAANAKRFLLPPVGHVAMEDALDPPEVTDG